MSYYYNYYIGYRKDGKFYPWGPYNRFGKIVPALSKSRSFASPLHNYFVPIQDKDVSDELRAQFEYTDWQDRKRVDVKYLDVNRLPIDDYIKRGYFLIKEVQNYDSNFDWFDEFTTPLTPEVYAAKVQHELTFGKNQPQKDDEGFEYTEPNASDYMYFAYPDYNSQEYEAAYIHQVADSLWSYDLEQDGAEFVILETEG